MIDCSVEEWKPVVGFEDAYEVSNRGRVRQRGRRSNCRIPKVMKQNLFRGGIHLYVGLCPHGLGNQNTTKIQKKIGVHVLVAAAFLGERPLGMHINHKDGCGLNNWAENLEYCTPTENVHHAFRHGLTVFNLTPEKVRQIRAYPASITTRAISKIIGVDESQVSRVRRRKSWAFID